jgi:hypothetical protein
VSKKDLGIVPKSQGFDYAHVTHTHTLTLTHTRTQDVNKEDWAAVNAWMDAALAGLNQRELKPVGEGECCQSLGVVTEKEGAGGKRQTLLK